MLGLHLLVCLSVAYAASFDPHLFQKVGHTSKYTTTAYITIDVNLKKLFKSIQDSLDVIEHYQTATGFHDQLTTFKKQILRTLLNVNHVLGRNTVELRDNIQFVKPVIQTTQSPTSLQPSSHNTPSVPSPRPEGLDFILSRAPTTTSRERRSIGLLDGFVAISKLTGSIFNWITHLTAQGDLRKVKFQVETNSKKVGQLHSKLTELLNNYNQLVQATNGLKESVDLTKAAVHVLEVATQSYNSIRTIYLALLELQQNHLPLDLVPAAELTQSFNGLKTTLATNGLVPIFDPDDLYLIKINAVFKNSEGLKIYIPVVTSEQEGYLDIYRLMPVPIQATNSTVLHIASQFQYLAISRSDGNDGKVFTEKDFSECVNEHKYFICPKKNFLMKNLQQYCIYNVYTRNTDKILDTCKVSFFKESHTALQISGNDFIVYTKKPDILSLTCETTNGQSVIENPFEFSVHFSLNSTCRKASTSGYTFKYQASLHQNSQVVCDPIPLNDIIVSPYITDLPSLITDSLPSLGIMPLSELKDNKFVLYMRIIKSWIFTYSYVFFIVLAIYILCHVICTVKTCYKKRHQEGLSYDDQLQRAWTFASRFKP